MQQATGRTQSRSRICSIALGSLLAIGLSYPAIAQVSTLQQQLAIPLNNGTRQPSREEADRLTALGRTQAHQGQLPEAIQVWQQALQRYQALTDMEAEAVVYGYLATAYFDLGQYRAAEDALRRQVALARYHRDAPAEIDSLNGLGRILAARDGGIPGAAQVYQEAFHLAQRVGSPEGMTLSQDSLGQLALKQGDMDSAKRYLEGALFTSRQAAEPVRTAGAVNTLGDLHRLSGRYSEAWIAYNNAIRLSQNYDDRPNQFRAIDGMIALTLAQRNLAQTETRLRERLTLAQAVKNRHQALLTHQALGRFYDLLGHGEQAKQSYHYAKRLAEEMGNVDQANLLQLWIMGFERAQRAPNHP